MKAVVQQSGSDIPIASAVKLMYIDGGCKQSLLNSFGLYLSNLPTLVAYAPFKSRFALFKGSLSEVFSISKLDDVDLSLLND